jgi:hypothetical protein
MKVGGGRGILEENISRRGVKKNRERSVEYSAVGCKVIVTFVIIFRMCGREGVYCEDTVCTDDNSKHRYN